MPRVCAGKCDRFKGADRSPHHARLRNICGQSMLLERVTLTKHQLLCRKRTRLFSNKNGFSTARCNIRPVDTESVTNNGRSEEHTSELQSPMRISYAVFCLKNKTKTNTILQYHTVINKK